jgi:3-oxoacyl-[acyl-carrier-protein] synthase-3
MLDYMRKKLGISDNSFVISMENRGNTVSASIPYAISDNGQALCKKDLFLLGFGIGASFSSVCLLSSKTE